jgi:hypothetical protein
VFGRERSLGVRSALGVASLPSNVAVAVEAVFQTFPNERSSESAA